MNKNTSKIPRNQRMSSELQKDIYEVISRKLKNPLITQMFSIVKVSVSKDLAHADIYLSVYSTDENKKMETFKLKNVTFTNHNVVTINSKFSTT